MGAVKKYKTIVTMPDKMSDEKADVINALGAMTVRTPTEVPHDDPSSHMSVARVIRDGMKDAVILDQYSNPANPAVHYDETAMELIRDGTCDGKRIDMVVMGAGTGGTVTGVARRLHEHDPGAKVIGVDPVGSVLSGGSKSHAYVVEGIGYDFIPDVLDVALVDGWERTEDKESFLMARDLIKHEGLLCGGSSGSAMVGAMRAVKRHNMNQSSRRIIVILPDSIRNYMTKFVSDDWMLSNEYFSISDFAISDGPSPPLETISMRMPCVELGENDTIQQFIERMEEGVTLVPVVKGNQPVGVICIPQLLKKIRTGGWLKGTDPLERAVSKEFVKIRPGMTMDMISRLVATTRFAFIVGDDDRVDVEDGHLWTVNPVALLKLQAMSMSKSES